MLNNIKDMSNIIEKDGKKYLVIGKVAIPFDKMSDNDKPIIEVESEEIINEDGSKDVKIYVPTLKVIGENKT